MGPTGCPPTHIKQNRLRDTGVQCEVCTIFQKCYFLNIYTAYYAAILLLPTPGPPHPNMHLFIPKNALFNSILLPVCFSNGDHTQQ